MHSDELCRTVAGIIGAKLQAGDFLSRATRLPPYNKARYAYIYFCRAHLNCPFEVINETMAYRNEKTIYKVFARQYERHRDREFQELIKEVKIELLKTN